MPELQAARRDRVVTMFRVWFRRGDENWWKPYEAATPEAAVKLIRPRSRQRLVTKVAPMVRWSDKQEEAS